MIPRGRPGRLLINAAVSARVSRKRLGDDFSPSRPVLPAQDVYLPTSMRGLPVDVARGDLSRQRGPPADSSAIFPRRARPGHELCWARICASLILVSTSAAAAGRCDFQPPDEALVATADVEAQQFDLMSAR